MIDTSKGISDDFSSAIVMLQIWKGKWYRSYIWTRSIHRKLCIPGLLSFQVEGHGYYLQSCEPSQMRLFISIQFMQESTFHWLWSAWSTCLYYFLDGRKNRERRGSSSYDSQRGIVITFFECLSNKITTVISLKMYKKPLAFRKVMFNFHFLQRQISVQRSRRR